MPASVRDRRARRARARTPCCACTPPTTRLPRARARTLARGDGRAADGGSGAVRTPDPRAARAASRTHPIEAFGWYSHDNDAILAGTWAAAVGAVDVTLSAWHAVADGAAPHAYALVPAARPPRGRRLVRGLLLPEQRRDRGAAWADRGARVAILDVDYHHGNGTQQIFYDRADVCFVSLHADPADEYPFFSGYADERGAGARRGYDAQLSRCRSAPTGPRYGPALDDAIGVIDEFAPDGLVVSLGVDTAAEDSDTLPARRRRLPAHRRGDRARLRVPTVFVQEGGYDLDVIGRNVVGVLRAFAGERA